MEGVRRECGDPVGRRQQAQPRRHDTGRTGRRLAVSADQPGVGAASFLADHFLFEHRRHEHLEHRPGSRDTQAPEPLGQLAHQRPGRGTEILDVVGVADEVRDVVQRPIRPLAPRTSMDRAAVRRPKGQRGRPVRGPRRPPDTVWPDEHRRRARHQSKGETEVDRAVGTIGPLHDGGGSGHLVGRRYGEVAG